MRTNVDWRVSIGLVGTVLKWLAVPLSFPLSIAVYYGETLVPFGATILLALASGAALERLGERGGRLGPREAFQPAAVRGRDVSQHRTGVRHRRPLRYLRGVPTSTKLLMIVLMWVGRIELIPVLVLFTRAFWKS